MAWFVPSHDLLPSATRGFRAQWLLVERKHGFPPLLALLGLRPRVLVAVANARCVANASPDASLIFTTFEAELATVMGHPTCVWPRQFKAARWPHNVAIRGMSPGQALLLDPGPSTNPAVRALCVGLANAAFSPDVHGPGLSRTQRIRACSPAVPPCQRARWETDLALEPPEVLAPLAGAAARRLVAKAFPDGGGVSPVDAATFEPLTLVEALDALLAATTARAAQRASGTLIATPLDQATQAPALTG